MTEATSSWFGPADHTPGVWEVEPQQGSFGRLWRAFMLARVTIAAMLVILQGSIYALGSLPSRWAVAVCIGYLCATLVVFVLVRPRPPSSNFDLQWLYTIGVDVMAFSALSFLQSGGVNYTPLFALPVLLASILGPLLLALGTAASVTLFLLGHAWWLSLLAIGELPSRFLQAGLSGSGFFAVALLANQLALRLAREEQRAEASQSVARMQTQVNELVVETLSDGVLVIDANGIARSANPASIRLLATRQGTRAAPFVLANEAAWQPLAAITNRTFTLGTPQEAEINLDDRRLHVRTRLATSQNSRHESLCVMFLEDLREMEARVRTEKMAAMGRMSAAVAHEIRNPLAAISQANALLEEDLQDPAQRQLTAMVRQNAQRLARIVDDVLNVSRAQVSAPDQAVAALELDDAVTRISADWSAQVSAGLQLMVAAATAQAHVVFDAEHLRRVMINLLDNALRYASKRPGAIEVATELPARGQVRLLVWSDGAPIEKTVQTHLFEPFFSSESRSTGLGLYICRELCERYGAVIGYQRTTRHAVEGNEFFVLFRAAAGERVPAPHPSDTFAA
ncbi:MAG: ATP-binding protein [Pseudomonadota bacterium]